MSTLDSVSRPAAAPRFISREQARTQLRIRRAGVYAVAIILALWILLPIWLIADLAFSTQENVRAFPKSLFPVPLSTETMTFFLNTSGHAMAGFFRDEKSRDVLRLFFLCKGTMRQALVHQLMADSVMPLSSAFDSRW